MVLTFRLGNLGEMRCREILLFRVIQNVVLMQAVPMAPGSLVEMQVPRLFLDQLNQSLWG